MAPLEVGPVSSSRAERTFRSQAARRPPLSTVISYSSVVRARIGCPCCVRRASNGRLVRTAPILGRRRHSSAVEQLFRKQQVRSSNLRVGSNPLSRSESLVQAANLATSGCHNAEDLLTERSLGALHELLQAVASGRQAPMTARPGLQALCRPNSWSTPLGRDLPGPTLAPVGW